MTTKDVWFQGYMSLAMLSCLFSLLALTSSFSNDDNPTPAITLEGRIESYNKFGAAMLSFTEADMAQAGFTLGDVISITVKDKTIEAPYFDGYYVLPGEYVCVAYPTYPSVCFTSNNVGLPAGLRGLEGQTVVVRMKQKGGKSDVQEALSMKYTNIRTDYASDEIYANARAVKGGRIAGSRLYRSTTPFSNTINRAEYVSRYLEQHKVKSVLNLTDTEEDMAGYDMPAYSRTLWEGGNVILCPLKADPTAADFNNPLIAALKELAKKPAPYLVHCTEGKDRTGYVCAFLEGLCGATYEEITDDYLTTFDNFYHLDRTKDLTKYDALLHLNLNPCLMFYAGVESESQLAVVDYAKAFSTFLLSHGMSQDELDALIRALATP